RSRSSKASSSTATPSARPCRRRPATSSWQRSSPPSPEERGELGDPAIPRAPPVSLIRIDCLTPPGSGGYTRIHAHDQPGEPPRGFPPPPQSRPLERRPRVVDGRDPQPAESGDVPGHSLECEFHSRHHAPAAPRQSREVGGRTPAQRRAGRKR